MLEIYQMLARGGIVMIPLLLISVLALAVVIERALFLHKNRILKPHVIKLVNQIEKPQEAEMALATMKDEDGPFLNVMRAGLERRGQTRDEIKEAILDQGRQETNTLERGLGILETIAGIAPLLGLLGTVLGMIKVFQVISNQGLGQTQLLSGGISEALITTVVGLSIAIPTLVAYNYFTHKVEHFVLEIEKHSSHLMGKLDRMRNQKE
ncbi:MotA/TolQ/ExbB proton channel family protein [candidate division KSB1 bacterium]|nr:MotA/TolQ/ExbB proton channel family protein [candidate division KSB1 bacterium]